MAEETTQEVQTSTDAPEVPESGAITLAEKTEQPQPAQGTNAPKEPDEIQPFILKATETIQHEVDDIELDKFLRAHIKTFREEWDEWSSSAKNTYIHLMTSQLLQRKAAATQIMIGNVFKLPVPSAQTQLFESIKNAQRKPLKLRPKLLMPPNLQPT